MSATGPFGRAATSRSDGTMVRFVCCCGSDTWPAVMTGIWKPFEGERNREVKVFDRNFAPVSVLLNPCNVDSGVRSARGAPASGRRAPGRRRPSFRLNGGRADRGHLQVHWFANQLLERLEVAMRRPEFELRIGRGVQLYQQVGAAIVDFKAGHHLRVTAVQAFRNPENRRQGSNSAPQRRRQFGVLLM